MAGVRTTYETLSETGQGERFDIFILSGSTNPDVWVTEEEAWYDLCSSLDAFGHIFYRKRRSNIKREQQRRGLLPPVEELPLHDRLRRGQHHGRDDDGPDRADHGASAPMSESCRPRPRA